MARFGEPANYCGVCGTTFALGSFHTHPPTTTNSNQIIIALLERIAKKLGA